MKRDGDRWLRQDILVRDNMARSLGIDLAVLDRSGREPSRAIAQVRQRWRLFGALYRAGMPVGRIARACGVKRDTVLRAHAEGFVAQPMPVGRAGELARDIEFAQGVAKSLGIDFAAAFGRNRWGSLGRRGLEGDRRRLWIVLWGCGWGASRIGYACGIGPTTVRSALPAPLFSHKETAA